MASSIQKIRLLGSSFSLKIDEDPAYFKKIMTYVETRFSEIQEEMTVNDPLRVAILSCILITDELFKERSKRSSGLSEKDAEEVEKMTLEIMKLIDSAL